MSHLASLQKLTIIRHGAQGILDTASKGQLESEFGTHKDDEVITQIIEKGSIIESEVSTFQNSSARTMTLTIT